MRRPSITTWVWWLLFCASVGLIVMGAVSSAQAQTTASAPSGTAVHGSGPAPRAAASGATHAALERRLLHLTEQLRCLVCQNQTIADSHADLAVDLKNEVREMLARGESDQQVIDFMVDRYGEFVLYRPPVKTTTWLLWFGPFALLLTGLVVLLGRLRRTRGLPETLSPAEQDRAARLLADAPLPKESA